MVKDTLTNTRGDGDMDFINLDASLKLCRHDGSLENGLENPFGQFFCWSFYLLQSEAQKFCYIELRVMREKLRQVWG